MAMIECPKCRFVQPKDEYCAKCGIEVSSYKEPAPTIGQAVTRKPLHTSLGIIAVVLLASYFLFPKSKMLSSFVPRILISESTSGTARSGISEEQLSSEEPTDSEDTGDDLSAEAKSFADDTDGDTAAPLASQTDSKIPELKIVIAEVPLEQIQNLIEAGEASGNFIKSLDQIAGLIPASMANKALAESQILATKSIAVDGPKEANWFWGQQDPLNKTHFGFWSRFELIDYDGSTLRGNFTTDRYLRDPAGSLEINSTQKTLAASIEISGGTHFLMTQLLPSEFKSNLLQAKYDLSKNEIFKVFASEKFAKGQSDLVLFIQLKKDQALTK